MPRNFHYTPTLLRDSLTITICRVQITEWYVGVPKQILVQMRGILFRFIRKSNRIGVFLLYTSRNVVACGSSCSKWFVDKAIEHTKLFVPTMRDGITVGESKHVEWVNSMKRTRCTSSNCWPCCVTIYERAKDKAPRFYCYGRMCTWHA